MKRHDSSLSERFHAKWVKWEHDGKVCWLWTAALSKDGYGRLWDRDYQRSRPSHQISYELHVGPIPEGTELDHLCRVRRCVNPAHLEPVTKRENILRGEGPSARQAAQTHCKRGHELSGPNLRVDKDGRRNCRTCNRDKVRRQYYAKRGLPVPEDLRPHSSPFKPPQTPEQVARIEQQS